MINEYYEIWSIITKEIMKSNQLFEKEENKADSDIFDAHSIEEQISQSIIDVKQDWYNNLTVEVQSTAQEELLGSNWYQIEVENLCLMLEGFYIRSHD